MAWCDLPRTTMIWRGQPWVLQKDTGCIGEILANWDRCRLDKATCCLGFQLAKTFLSVTRWPSDWRPWMATRWWPFCRCPARQEEARPRWCTEAVWQLGTSCTSSQLSSSRTCSTRRTISGQSLGIQSSCCLTTSRQTIRTETNRHALNSCTPFDCIWSAFWLKE